MNTKLLKAESSNLTMAYVVFFIIQAPYGYVGKWGYQILYWMVAVQFYGSILRLFGHGVETAMTFPEILGGIVLTVLCAIWPVNMFFSLPNLVKKENLRLYEIMSNKK